MEFYASCPEGFESALADELKRLGLSHVRRLKGRATFEGELEEGYRACLWSRLASRVFAVLGRFEAQNADELYDSVYDIAWESIVRPGATIAITARGVTEQLRNTRFSALRAKDALCDRLAETTGRRADVDAADPDVHLLLSLRQRRASISLDLSGDPLFKRLPPAATRAGEGAHVLRPDYAALVLAQVGWTALCERVLTADDYEYEGLPTLIDASCAGGGLLLEAVNILTDRAPGAARERWGFEGWQLHDAALWEQLLTEARERETAARERQARIVAADVDPAARKTAEQLVDESTEELERSIADIETINAKVRDNLNREKAEEDAHAYQQQYDSLTAEIEQLREDKRALLDGAKLPLTLTSYSPCFRKEKGAHGIEERGIYRIHQFEKQEMIVVCKPEDSMDWYDKLWKNSVELFRSMEIPVRQLECCSGDLADLKVKSCDIEAWSPRQKKYFEVCSCSNLGDAQARRLKIRVRGEDGKLYLPHTLNNTVVAPPRMLIALLENNLQADGSVLVPKALQPYMGGKERLVPLR